MNFVTALFAVAGVTAASGPIIIHLLNRRRFRVLDWAAMDFLREAMQRNRRIMQMRDLILLLLRILCLVFFGFALARPFLTNIHQDLMVRYFWLAAVIVAAFGLALWAVLSTRKISKVVGGIACGAAVLVAFWSGMQVIEARASLAEGNLNSRHPVHAVLLFDNSLSMATETQNGTFLDEAKEKAREFIEELPPKSRVSVIPLCGSVHAFTLDAYRSKEDALEAVSLIDVVDRSASVSLAVELAATACEKVPELPAKRVVLLSDQQVGNWPASSSRELLKRVPELQVVQVGVQTDLPPENVWISELRVQDGIADIETTTTFLVTVEYQGTSVLNDVQITLTVDDVIVATQSVELRPGQSLQREFPYQIDIPAEPGTAKFVTAQATVKLGSSEHDELPRDNTRYLSVPVVAGLPVVFIDQVGVDEETPENRGETYRLRRLLAPRESREFQKQLIQTRHTTIKNLDQKMLQNARLVIMAGVEEPTAEAVQLLREYVLQGGQLVIAAGGDFNPKLWNQSAWLDGAGILPAPLDHQVVGVSPTAFRNPQELIDKKFHLDFSSMVHDYFLIEGEPRERLQVLYSQPMFFKAIHAQIDEDMLEDLVDAEIEQIEHVREQIEESEENRKEWAAKEREGRLSPTEEALKIQDEELRRRLEPNWLQWQKEQVDHLDELTSKQLAERSRPRVLARFLGNDLPFLVDRRIGRGQVLFFTSGVYSDWNNLTTSNSMLMFDRILRRLLEETLPVRTFTTGARIALPADRNEELSYTLKRPNGVEENLPVLALGPETYGITVQQALSSGIYQITVYQSRASSTGTSNTREKEEEMMIVINGPAEESDLTPINQEGLEQRLGEDANYSWIGSQEKIRVEGAQIRGRDLWKIFIILALVCLAAELLVLAWPRLIRHFSARPQEPVV